MARQGLHFGATKIVLNESFGCSLWRRRCRRRNCSTASVVQKINAQIAAPLGLYKKLPAQIVIVQEVKLEPCYTARGRHPTNHAYLDRLTVSSDSIVWVWRPRRRP